MNIKRLDHHGLVAGVIDDLKLVELLDQHLPQDPKQEITPGEAVKGMIMNGLGFSNRPLSLSPQFFTNLPMEHLFRVGVQAEHFNRHKLGRTLDQCAEFGCESLFGLLSLQACQLEQVNTQFQSLDTTSFTLSGEYAASSDTDEEIIHITHGYSKDHRPDLKQVVQEMLVSQDGGIPLACKNWDGNASDSEIFKLRAKALIKHFQNADTPNFCIADSKLYHQNNATFLSQLRFITRVPSTIKQEKTITNQALSRNDWVILDDNYRYQSFNITHYDIEQRWLVVHSKAAAARAEKTLQRQVDKSQQALDKACFHLQAQRFSCEHDALQAVKILAKKQKYHRLVGTSTTAHPQYAGKGRPKKNAEVTSTLWQVHATFEQDEQNIRQQLDMKSCFTLTTNADTAILSDRELIARYKGQSSVEQGFRFLKDPLFFVSSLFIKKPSRIDALLMIMTLSLLIYSIAQRRLRANMKKLEASIPNQINQPTKTPTLRWIFQCFEGINIVQTTTGYNYDNLHIDGMTELRQRVVRFLRGRALLIYKIQNLDSLV